MVVRPLLVGLGLLALAAPAALAQAPARPAAPPAAPAQPPLDPAQAASKAAYDRLEEAERKAIQNDLIWTGDFNGVAGGEFGRRTYDALLAFERRGGAGRVADAILTPPERAALKQEADRARAGVGFAEVTDGATGIRIGMPQAILTQRVAVENGVVFRRADGQVSLQLQQLPGGLDLPNLFERMRQDAPGRKVTYRLLRPEWFVVSGDEGARKFYTRVAQGPAGIRAYTFRYPAAEAKAMDRLMVAIANTFEPFPGTAVAANPSRALAQGAAQVAPGAQPGVASASASALQFGPARHALSGVVVAPNRVLTSAAALRSCAGAAIGGQPIPAGAVTEHGEAALIAVPTGGQPALALAAGASPDRVYTLSFEDAAQRTPLVAAGALEPGQPAHIRAALQIGPGGAPVVDAAGALVALVRESPGPVRMVAGVAPVARYAVIDAKAVAEALAAARVAPAPRAAGLAGAAAALVEIRCARRA